MKLREPPGYLRGLVGWPGAVIALAWGFAEATLFFIVPDVFITLVALVAVRRSVAWMVLVMCGALVGGTVMYAWSAASPGARRAVEHVPFVTSRMLERVDENYAAYGAAAMLVGPLSGIPYKAYAVEAPGRISLPVFLLMSVPARLERFVITWVMFAPAGLWVRSRRRDYTKLALAGWAAYWVIVYAIYWGIV